METIEPTPVNLTDAELDVLSGSLPRIVDRSDEFGADEITLLSEMVSEYVSKNQHYSKQGFRILSTVCGAFSEIQKSSVYLSSIYEKAKQAQESLK